LVRVLREDFRRGGLFHLLESFAEVVRRSLMRRWKTLLDDVSCSRTQQRFRSPNGFCCGPPCDPVAMRGEPSGVAGCDLAPLEREGLRCPICKRRNLETRTR
jgi:hypothetical protein